MHDSYSRNRERTRTHKRSGAATKSSGTPLLDLIGATERALAEDGRVGMSQYLCQSGDCADTDGFCWVCGETHRLPTLGKMRRLGNG